MNKLPFIEKYRASNLDEIVLDLNSKELIFNAISEGNMPNFFFYSHSAGTGKTSMAKIIIATLACDKLVLNASDERGIDTIREKVSGFCKSMSMIKGAKRCVFLDEADYLTSQAQASLRNLMEEVSSNAFFILTANYEDKIIDALKSRCTIQINFNSPNEEEIEARLLEICANEKIETDYIPNIIENFYPDIRSMVSSLQSIKLGKDFSSIFKELEIFKTVVKEIASGKFDSVRNRIVNDGIDVPRFVKWLFKKTVELNLSPERVSELCLILADIEKYIVQGVTPKIIFLANIVRLQKCLKV